MGFKSVFTSGNEEIIIASEPTKSILFTGFGDKKKECLEPSISKKLNTIQREEYKNLDKAERLKELMAEQLELYKIKNKKYGDSFGISVKKYRLS